MCSSSGVGCVRGRRETGDTHTTAPGSQERRASFWSEKARAKNKQGLGLLKTLNQQLCKVKVDKQKYSKLVTTEGVRGPEEALGLGEELPA